MPLVCSQCGKENPFGDFFQVSYKISANGHYREIQQRTNGIHISKWIPLEKGGIKPGFPKASGIYCQYDGSPVVSELILNEEMELLKDKRLPFSKMDTDQIIRELSSTAERLRSEIHAHTEEAITGAYANAELADWIKEKLERMGIQNLYVHQAEAIRKIRAGKNVVICTKTASGKSLAYLIPILETLCNDERATALYLSPYNALAEDQFSHLLQWMDPDSKKETIEIDGFIRGKMNGKTIGIGILKGQNTQPYMQKDQTKEFVYSQGRIWLTNVHYLHLILRGLVSFKRKKKALARFLKNLRFVVLDEVHLYSGILGSKVAMVIRRLRMLCERLGNKDIQFLACSATIANPKELAEELTGKKGIQGFELIVGEQVPQKRKTYLLWNPGVNAVDGGKRAMVTELYEILRTVYRKGRWPRTIIFTSTRQQAQLLSRELNQILRTHLMEQRGEKIGNDLFLPYHAHLPQEIRSGTLERLDEGELLGVVATNALEAGIDIKHLDLCIMMGYPGSQASFMQKAGRVGRNQEGMVILMMNEKPLEQYFFRRPDAFFKMPPESAVINTSNLRLLSEHLRYSAYEQKGKLKLPQRYFRATAIRKVLQNEPDVWMEKNGIWFYKGEEPVYKQLNQSNVTFRVVRQKGWKEEVLFEGVDQWTLIRDYHLDAVFLGHDNQTFYRVRYVDYKKRKVIAEPIKTEYFTRGIVRDSIDLKDLIKEEEIAGPYLKTGIGNILIKRNTFGYKRHFLHSGKEPETVQIHGSYPVSFLTDACWFIFEAEGREWIKDRLRHCMEDSLNPNELFEASLHAVEHAIAAAIPVVVKCSSSDFHHVSSFSGSLFYGMPGIIFYENHQGGGCGIAEAIVENWPKLLARAYEMIHSCHCQSGCPACIQLFHCERQNEMLHKKGGILLIEGLLEMLNRKVSINSLNE